MTEIEHFSGSSLNLYDEDIHQFYTRYVLWQEPQVFLAVKEAMEYWKAYEEGLFKELEPQGYVTQYECRNRIGEYELLGYFDFYNEKEKKVIECKTKSWWWSENDVRTNWQFRYYNRWCNNNGYDFILHQWNKKKAELKEEKINWQDDEFVADFLDKAREVEVFLTLNWVKVKHYEIQENAWLSSWWKLLQAGNNSVEGLRVWDNKRWRKKKWQTE